MDINSYRNVVWKHKKWVWTLFENPNFPNHFGFTLDYGQVRYFDYYPTFFRIDKNDDILDEKWYRNIKKNLNRIIAKCERKNKERQISINWLFREGLEPCAEGMSYVEKTYGSWLPIGMSVAEALKLEEEKSKFGFNVVAATYIPWCIGRIVVPKLYGIHKNANLQGRYLSHAMLEFEDLSNCNLANTKMRHTKLTGARMANSDLSQAVLAAAQMNSANLENAILAKATLLRCNLVRTNLTGAVLDETDFTESIRSFNDPEIPGWKVEHYSHLTPTVGVMRRAN